MHPNPIKLTPQQILLIELKCRRPLVYYDNILLLAQAQEWL